MIDTDGKSNAEELAMSRVRVVFRTSEKFQFQEVAGPS